MSKRRFAIEFFQLGIFVDAAVVELDQAVIDAVDDGWRKMFYPLHTPEDIAEHIGRNMILNGWQLSDLDGWADQPNENAAIVEWPDLDDYTLDVTEIGADD